MASVKINLGGGGQMLKANSVLARNDICTISIVVAPPSVVTMTKPSTEVCHHYSPVDILFEIWQNSGEIKVLM
jgi:hypothetical protein